VAEFAWNKAGMLYPLILMREKATKNYRAVRRLFRTADGQPICFLSKKKKEQ
jgi:hypothetical protein